MHYCQENLSDFSSCSLVWFKFNISNSWPVTPPTAAAAAGFPVTPPPPVEVSRRAAAAGRKHPACRRRQNDVGLGLYFNVVVSEKLVRRRCG